MYQISYIFIAYFEREEKVEFIEFTTREIKKTRIGTGLRNA